MTLSPDHVILGLLAFAPQHGYQMLECFGSSACLGQIWRLNASQLYNTLKRLERDGLISGHGAPSESGPPRTIYHLTEAGHAQLMDWLHVPVPSASIRRLRVEFPSRLFVAHLLGVPSAPILERQRAACQREHERLLTQLSQTVDGMAKLALTFVIEQLEAALRWLERCEQIALDALTACFHERRPS
ncbi:MAG: PadR family transcriptional regulator [Aggregatilineales bacterium]